MSKGKEVWKERRQGKKREISLKRKKRGKKHKIDKKKGKQDEEKIRKDGGRRKGGENKRE